MQPKRRTSLATNLSQLFDHRKDLIQEITTISPTIVHIQILKEVMLKLKNDIQICYVVDYIQ